MFLILPSIAFAAQSCNIPNAPSAEKLCDAIGEIGDIIAIGGIAIAVIFIIVGGIKYLTAGDSEDKTKSARKMITNALIGVAIILVAYFLVQMVAEFVQQRFN